MKLDFSNAWADSVALLRGQAELVLTLTGVFLLLPPLLIELFIPFRPSEQVFAVIVREFSEYARQNGGLLLLSTLVTAFGQLAIIRLLLDPARPTVGQALKGALPLLPWFFLTGLIVNLILIAGFLALILPAAYLLGRLAVAGVAVGAENRRNPFDAIRRSFEISKGNGWRIFLLIAIVWVTGSIVSLAISTIIGVILAVSGGGAAGAFVAAFVTAALGALLGLILLLLTIAIYRQLSHPQGPWETSGT